MEGGRLPLPAGKLPVGILRSLLAEHPILDPRVLVGPAVGEDAAVVDMGDRCLVAATDPVTFATDEIGWYVVVVNANDVATRGARPRWFLWSLLMPEGHADRALVERIFAQVAAACRAVGAVVVGGHTEITPGLPRPIAVGTMLGEVSKEQLVATTGAQAGDDLILTKGIAVEGTAILARERGEWLIARGVAPALVARAAQLLETPGISVVAEAMAAVEGARIHAMHDPTEGGLATALVELGEAAQVGVEIEAEAIPVLPETTALCEVTGIDPIGLIASGALLIACPSDETPRVLQAVAAVGTSARRIGRLCAPGEGHRLRRGGRELPLPTFSRDEIVKIFGPEMG
ncbi:MAG: AIR synthase family protein [Candidatus Methylomirabilales bacterium]